MTCDEIQHCILLMDAGELEPAHRPLITNHIKTCVECSAFQQETRLLTRAADRALPSAEPSQDVINAIMNEATGRSLKTEKNVLTFPSYATQLLAYAACFAVVVLGWFIMTQTPTGPNAGVLTADAGSDHVEAVSQLLVDLDAGEDDVVAEVAQDHDAQLDQLADELMRFQGFDPSFSENEIFASL